MKKSGVNQKVTRISQRVSTKIKSRVEQFQANLSFLVVPAITEKLPLIKFDKNKVNYSSNIKLADEMFHVPIQIDLLLGVSTFYELLKNGKISLGSELPVLQETHLGWVFAARIALPKIVNQNSVCNLSTKITNKDLNETLNKFCTIENIPNKTFSQKRNKSAKTFLEKQQNATVRVDS